MKYLVLILAILVALPTVQAGYCSMGEVQDSTVQDASEGHDCCPGDAADEAVDEGPCEDGDHCSACMIAVSALSASLTPISHARPDARFTAPLPFVAPSHSAPPYRPPFS